MKLCESGHINPKVRYICINWHSFKIETFHRKFEDKVCGIAGTVVCLFVTVGSGKNHFLLTFPFFGTGDGVYCFTLMPMSSDDRYFQHFSGHLTLSLSHTVHLICSLVHTLTNARIYSHIRVDIHALLYYLQHKSYLTIHYILVEAWTQNY